MKESKKTTLVKIEFILFGILLLIFMIWMSRRCSRTQLEYEAAAKLAEETADDSIYIKPSATAELSTKADSTKPRPATAQAAPEKRTTLFVCIEGLNMRSGPGLRYTLLERFPLHTELGFMGEVTPTIDTIKLGKITAAEPWVKVRSPKGRDGWVFGAGVRYYKHQIEIE